MNVNTLYKGIMSFFYFSFFFKKDARHIYITCGAIGDACYGLATYDYLSQCDPESLIYVNRKNAELLNKSFPQVDKSKIIFYCSDSLTGSLINILVCNKILCSYFRRNGIFVMYLTNRYRLTDLKCEDMLTVISEDVFKIHRLPIITYPKVPDVPVTTIPDFEKNKDKIVVCNPHSNSMILKYQDLWGIIVEKLKERGFIVYTNVIGDQLELAGTFPLSCSIYEFSRIAQEIPLIVSIRSGIMDYVVDTKSIKFIIFGECDVTTVSDSLMFGVYNMEGWRKDNIIQCGPTLTKEEIISKFEFLIGKHVC